MKRLVEIQWLRRTARGLAVLATLTVLGYAGFNWWAAREKGAAIERFVAAGGTFEIAGLLPPLPPDEENFAMIPLLVELRREVEEDRNSQEAQRVRELFTAMNVPAVKGKSRGTAGLEEMAVASGLTGSRADWLEQFDARHAGVIGSLRDGMGRKHAVSPGLHGVREAEMPTLQSSMNYPLSLAIRGLAFRAAVAAKAGRSDEFLESLLISRRLRETLMSEHVLISLLHGWARDSQVSGALGKGLEASILDSSELALLEEAWSEGDVRGAMIAAANLEAIYRSQMTRLAKTNRKSWMMITATHGKLHRLGLALAPDGYFDLLELRDLEEAREWMERFRKDGVMDFWNTAEEQRREVRRVLPFAILAQRGAASMVENALARAAIELEIFRTLKGSYPESLAEIGGEGILDPMTGEAFRFRRDGTGFRLYSVGPDGVDDGGEKGERNLRTSKDWVW